MAVCTAEFLPKITVRQPGTVANGVTSGQINVDLPYQGAALTNANGTLTGQCDVVWTDVRTLAVSTPVTLDLTALAAASTNGNQAAAFARLNAVYILSNETADSGKTLTIGGAASTQALICGLSVGTTTVTIKSGGFLYHYDPSTVGTLVSTNKSLKLDPGAATHSVTLVLVGRSV